MSAHIELSSFCINLICINTSISTHHPCSFYLLLNLLILKDWFHSEFLFIGKFCTFVCVSKRYCVTLKVQRPDRDSICLWSSGKNCRMKIKIKIIKLILQKKTTLFIVWLKNGFFPF